MENLQTYTETRQNHMETRQNHMETRQTHMDNQLTHIDETGRAKMVQVTDKAITRRSAGAEGYILITEDIANAIKENTLKKGDVFSVARIAGIMAVKKTGDLIPLCHPLMVTDIQVDFEMFGVGEKYSVPSIRAVCRVELEGKTGVEMEALTGVNVSLLTIYDMCKALSKEMVMTDIRLLEKSGGTSGYYHA